MSDHQQQEQIHSFFWEEQAEENAPYFARACFCSGYDVYGEIVPHASYIEYLYLLFRKERAASAQIQALNVLAIALANPGPRDPAVHAGMCAGVGGSPAAAVLMAGLAAGAGAAGGSRELYSAMQAWQKNGCDLSKWEKYSIAPTATYPAKKSVWPDHLTPAGFLADTPLSPHPVQQTLTAIAGHLTDGYSAWLHQHQEQLAHLVGAPLGIMCVAAASLLDLGFSPEQGEMLTLLLRLPGVAVHALEQQNLGIKKFPFFSLDIENDPLAGEARS